MAKVGFSRYQSYTTQKKRREKIVRFILFFCILYFCYLTFNALFLRTVLCESVSMEPTLKKGTFVLLSPLPLGNNHLPFLPVSLPQWRDPQRGELVEIVPNYHHSSPFWITIFDEMVRFLTGNWISLNESLRPAWDRPFILRRVVALPGDTIKIKDFIAYVRPNKEKYFLSEYELSKKVYSIKHNNLPKNWQPNFPFSSSMLEMTLGEDEYFVLSDNRMTFSDSRTWGVVKRSAFKALALLKYWPFNTWGRL